MHKNHPQASAQWMLPVVAETWDGYLNRINDNLITPEHAVQALDNAATGPVPEGSVGGGTGMNCYGFKGGSGTSSRLVTASGQQYTVGVFTQSNFGSRKELQINGAPIGRSSQAPCPIEDTSWFENDQEAAAIPGGSGSVIVVVGTDAPLLPGQAKTLARRVPLGLARTGTTGGHFSGDIFLAFSTGNPGALRSVLEKKSDPVPLDEIKFLPWSQMDALYEATVEAVEEAVLNALVNNRDAIGREGHFSPALPHAEVKAALAQRQAV